MTAKVAYVISLISGRALRKLWSVFGGDFRLCTHFIELLTGMFGMNPACLRCNPLDSEQVPPLGFQEDFFPLQSPEESSVPLQSPKESSVPLQSPEESFVPLQNPEESSVPLQSPTESSVLLQSPTESLALSQDLEESLASSQDLQESSAPPQDLQETSRKAELFKAPEGPGARWPGESDALNSSAATLWDEI
ncbi:hypothetical protein C0J50_3879 [Silurus asotus]|uniref:Uncharacterized protein n=1 Tax=Silurus asotus TaxID=30991 RepID=A0AAD5ACL6_SILAS|nr:hypothetical protein C0J50_3879 [Silurus asotus]